MHSIKKYQNGGSWSGVGPIPTPIRGLTTEAFDVNALNKSLKPINLNNPVTSGKGMLSGLGGLNMSAGNIGGIANTAIDLGLKTFGKEADTISGGEQVFSKGTDMAFNMALKTGNPYAIAGAGVLKGLDYLNRFAGSTSKKQGTIGLDTGGYNFQMNAQAGKKNTLLGTIGGKTKNQNKLTSYTDKQNLLAGSAAYDNKQNLMASNNYMQDVNSKNQQKLLGGLNANVLAAKKGTKINPNDFTSLIRKAQKGVKISFEEWYKTVPKEKNDTVNYNLRRAYELAPKEQLNAFVKDPNAHLMSVYENKQTGEYEFLKSKNHPTLQLELDWYNSNDLEAQEFRKKYKLDTTKDYYKYIPILKHENGGEINLIELPDPELLDVPEFEDGGKLNVIPEGALHARKHNLPEEIASQVTDKGIPVVTFEEGGDIKQHAEIEHSEIIFHKTTTDELEKLFKQYNDSQSDEEKENIALECGKFLALEILENTEDNVGILNK